MTAPIPFDHAIDRGCDFFGLLDGDDVPLWRWTLFVPAIIAFALLSLASVAVFFGRILWPKQAKR